MASVSFVVHGTAAPAGSKRGFYNPKAKRVIITDDSARSRPWKAQIVDAAVQAMTGQDMLDGPILLELVFWVTRPKSHYGTGRNTDKVKPGAPWAPTVKPDLLKLARAVEDALTGIVYRDDAQIITETLQKAYTARGPFTTIRAVTVVAPGAHRPDSSQAVARALGAA
jgi:Holliday junction resolvase RusA-like endonuclease